MYVMHSSGQFIGFGIILSKFVSLPTSVESVYSVQNLWFVCGIMLDTMNKNLT